jgi:hypothetical protein
MTTTTVTHPAAIRLDRAIDFARREVRNVVEMLRLKSPVATKATLRAAERNGFELGRDYERGQRTPLA